MTVKELLQQYEAKYPAAVIGVSIQLESGYCCQYVNISDLLHTDNYNNTIIDAALQKQVKKYHFDNENKVKNIFTKNFDKVLYINL